MFKAILKLYSVFALILASVMLDVGEFGTAAFLASAAVGAIRMANGSIPLTFSELMSFDPKRA